jgi:hypothetical protein
MTQKEKQFSLPERLQNISSSSMYVMTSFYFPRLYSTDERITISTQPVRPNARLSIPDNIDSDSKTTEKSDLQQEKQLSHKITVSHKISDSLRPHNLPISSPIWRSLLWTRPPLFFSSLFLILTTPTLPSSQFLRLIYSQSSYPIDRNALNSSLMSLFLAFRHFQFGDWFCQHDYHSLFLLVFRCQQLSPPHSSRSLPLIQSQSSYRLGRNTLNPS